MAAKPVDRIRTMINELERGARTLGDDIRKRAGNVSMTSDIETALRQLMQGLTNIAAQLEKAAGELRRYLEAGAKGGKKGARKAGGKRAAATTTRKTTRKTGGSKAASRKTAAKKSPAAVGKPAKKATRKKK